MDIIIYYSKHNNNTKNLCEEVAKECGIKTLDIQHGIKEDLSKYNKIGIASGIYCGGFSKSLIKYIKDNLPEKKNVFLLATSGTLRDNYFKNIRKVLIEKQANIEGSYMCLGYDNFGPLKLIGGTNKGHPDVEEIKKAIELYKKIK